MPVRCCNLADALSQSEYLELGRIALSLRLMDHSKLIPSPVAGVLGYITGEGLAGLREVTGL